MRDYQCCESGSADLATLPCAQADVTALTHVLFSHRSQAK